jgi:chitodextrinase
MRVETAWRTTAAKLRFCLFSILGLLALTGLSAATFNQADAAQAAGGTPGLVAAYGFDGGSGSTLADDSGNGNTGTIQGAAWVAGKSGSALSFNGSSNWVTVADSASLDLTSAMTLEAWVKPSALGTSWRTAVVKEAAGTLAYGLYAHDGGPGPSAHAIVTSDMYATTSSTLPVGAWTHLAATYDGSRLTVWINGTVAGSVALSGNVVQSSAPLRIGGNSIWSEWFSGSIDDVRVYNRALAQSEIKADMTNPVKRPSDTTPPSTPTGLTVSNVSQTGASLGWAASSDDVGVTGYDVSVNGTTVTRTTSTNYAVGGLNCGTSYTLGVTAVDAAGNSSSRATTTATTAACPPQAPGPVASYGFDAGSGSTLRDDSGHSNAGTITNAAWASNGKFGGALSFNGTNSLVTVADSPSLDLTSAMTVEGWVNPTTLGVDWRTVVVKEQPTQLAYALYAHEGGPGPGGHAYVGSDTSAGTSSTIPTGAWTYLATTYDGSTITLYVNGSKVATRSATGPMATSASPLRIGGNSIWGEWFSGLIDQVRVYNRSLTPAEIQTDMTTPIAAPSGGGGSPDTAAPSTPGTPVTGSTTATSVGLSWGASSDNVGVTGYDVYVNGTKAGTTTGTSYTASSLTCSTSYTLGVVAFDAAGNRSAQATTTATTATCTTPPPSGGTVANLWVDPSGGSCSRAATAGAYSDAAACGSLGAAFQAAQNGDSVLIKGGTYGSQRIDNRAGAAAPGVTLASASGESVTFGSLDICGADYMTLKGPMKLKSISTYNCYSSLATNDTIDGVNVDWGYDASQTDGSIVGLYGNVANFTMRNSTIQHGYNVKGFYMSSWSGGSSPYYYPTNITLEYSTIHSWNAANGIHTECVFANKVQGLTLRGDQFYDCLSTGDGIIGNAGTEPNNPRDYLFENNVFEASWNNPPCACGMHGVSFDGDAASLRGVNVFRYNLFETSMFSGSGSPAAGSTVDFYGNIGAAPSCVQMSRSAYNIWTNRTCGSTDRQNSSVLAAGNFVSFPPRPSSVSMPVDLAPGNWHYTSASVPMVDTGDPDSTCSAAGQIGGGSSPCWPARDKDSVARPLGGRPDAGPYEYR